MTKAHKMQLYTFSPVDSKIYTLKEYAQICYEFANGI